MAHASYMRPARGEVSGYPCLRTGRPRCDRRNAAWKNVPWRAPSRRGPFGRHPSLEIMILETPAPSVRFCGFCRCSGLWTKSAECRAVQLWRRSRTADNLAIGGIAGDIDRRYRAQTRLTNSTSGEYLYATRNVSGFFVQSLPLGEGAKREPDRAKPQ